MSLFALRWETYSEELHSPLQHTKFNPSHQRFCCEYSSRSWWWLPTGVRNSLASLTTPGTSHATAQQSTAVAENPKSNTYHLHFDFLSDIAYAWCISWNWSRRGIHIIKSWYWWENTLARAEHGVWFIRTASFSTAGIVWMIGHTSVSIFHYNVRVESPTPYIILWYLLHLRAAVK